MGRTWQELQAAASRTGTFDGYVGDGASIPWIEATALFPPLGVTLKAYKDRLDGNWWEAFRLHDWLYTPYGQLIEATRDEADEALRQHMIDIGGPGAGFNASVCFAAVRAAGGPWFGNSTVGFDPAVLAAVKRSEVMAIYRGTLLFENQVPKPPVGFSESWYFEASSDGQAGDAVAAWPVQRKKWLSSDWKITGYRCSAVTGASRSGKCVLKYKPVMITACLAPVAGLLGTADNPYAAVYFQLVTTANQAKRGVFLGRGIPDTWFDAGVLNIPNADGNKVLAWWNFMVSANSIGRPKKNPANCTSLTLDAYFSYCVKRYASRKIGRPFGLLRGRQRKKKVAP